MDNFHDYETEEKINAMKIDVYFPKELFEVCNDDFEVSYVEEDALDDSYGNTYLRKLFERGFKYFYLNKDSNLYGICKELGNHIIYSPFSNNKEVMIFKKRKELYYISGKSYLPKNIKKVFIGYLGEIGNCTKVQLTVFDYIKE